MESKDEIPSKGNQGEFGRECRVCRESNARSPAIRSFISLVNHLLEHQAAKEKEQLRVSFDPRTGNLMDSPAAEETPGFQGKISSNQKAVLPVVSDWLHLALRGTIDYPSAPDVAISEGLLNVVKQLPEEYSDQRAYLLKYPHILEALAADSDWPRTPGLQAKFVADSLAGVQWGLKPSTSREYVREVNKQKVPVPDLVRWGLQDWFRQFADDADAGLQ